MPPDSAISNSVAGTRGSADLVDLEARINAILPSQYQSCYDDVSPVSMGSADLKYDADSRVAWDQIWTHYCDLALAGGPPHRGTLLEAPTAAEVDAEPAGHHVVREEIVRGIRMTTGLDANADPEVGWVAVRCPDEATASWLLRAVMAENVFVQRRQATLRVPAGPHFRPAKEIKNVVVALAKTCHYWQSHFTDDERRVAAATIANADAAGLLEPLSRPEALAQAGHSREQSDAIGRAIEQATGMAVVRCQALGWVGFRCGDEKSAAWYVRSAIAMNVLARRESDVLVLPTQAPPLDVELVERVTLLHRLRAKGDVRAT